MKAAQAHLADRNSTFAYYDNNARSYADATFDVDMSAIYARFLRYVASDGLILDAGSGSGRDTLAFLKLGYRVEAFDASPRLSELSALRTGVQTLCMQFQEVSWLRRYDGIWACASLLHVPLLDLGDATMRLIRALKPGGALYASFKYGTGERETSDGRTFVDMNEEQLSRLLAQSSEMTIAEIWQSGGEGSRRGGDSWLNAIAIRSSQ